MNRSEAINELATALSKAQGEMGAVIKGSTATTPKFSYKYATLEDVLAVIKQPLIDNDLTVTQLMGSIGDQPALTTLLMHKSDQWIEDTVPLVKVQGNGTNEAQELGISTTYTKRYSLAAMFMLSIIDDTDGTTQQTTRQSPPMTKNEFNNAPAIEPNAATEFLQVDRVGCVLTKAGDKPHLGLFEQNMKWPTFHYWKGRDALLESCPWVGEIATKDQLGEQGKTYPFSAKVYYTLNDKQYKVVQRIERITTA